MTISAFCRDQLLAQGPLPLETLAELAADAGKTTARDPAAAIRSALAYKEVLLADGRWATPLWLLEGRILTARRLPLVTPWPESARDDGYDDVLAYEAFLPDPDLGEIPADYRHDLTLLDLAAKSSALPLAAGGVLRGSRYGHGWQVPKGWPAIAPGRDRLLGLRVRTRRLHVELVALTDELYAAGDRLAHELGPLDTPGCYWSAADSLVSENLSSALWNRMAEDPRLLTSPVPPFSECIPALAVALRLERERRAAEARRWRPQLDLPAALQQVAVRGRGAAGGLLDEWLNAYVLRVLREFDEGDNGDEWIPAGEYGQVLPLQSRNGRA